MAVAADNDENGVFDDAPSSVPDADGDSDVDREDLKEIGLTSKVEEILFEINPDQ